MGITTPATPLPATPIRQIQVIFYNLRRVEAAMKKDPANLGDGALDLLEMYNLSVGLGEYAEDRVERDVEHQAGLHTSPELRCARCEQEQADAAEDEAHRRNAHPCLAGSAA